MNMKNIAKLTVMVLALFILSTTAFAAVNVESVKINGEVYEDGDSLVVELGSDLDIKVKLRADTNATEDVEVAARLIGYNHADTEKLRTYDMVIVDSMDATDVEYVTLNLDVPKNTDKDYYYVRIYVDDKQTQHDFVHNIRLNVKGEDNKVDIVRVSFDPAEVVAGRALRTRVKMENLGESNEDDVYIKVAIPALGPGMLVTADIDELDEGEVMTSEDLLLRIPACTEAGTYEVEVTVEYDNGYSSTTVTEQIKVLADETCTAAIGQTSGRTVITPPQNQDVTIGANGVSFPVVISNEGATDKVYSVTVSGVSGWGSVEITNPAPLVKAGDNEVVYVYVTADSKAAEGKQVFEITVSDGTDSRKVPVTANVVKASGSIDWKNVLYVGVIVLLVLVVILGLVIGFNKTKGDNEKEYY